MTELHVRVRVADEDYALSVNDVLEVCAVGDITPVPGAPETILGLTNLRGNVIAVVDLAAVLSLPEQRQPARMVVAAHGDRRAALAVDSIVGVDELPASPEPADSQHLTGAALVDGALIGVIDVAAVLDHVQQGPPR